MEDKENPDDNLPITKVNLQWKKRDEIAVDYDSVDTSIKKQKEPQKNMFSR